jgi:hypothetical protein
LAESPDCHRLSIALQKISPIIHLARVAGWRSEDGYPVHDDDSLEFAAGDRLGRIHCGGSLIEPLLEAGDRDEQHY